MQLCIDTFYQLYCKIRHSTLFTKQKIKWSSFYKSQGPRSDGHPKIITGWWKKCVHLVQVLCCTSSQEPLHTSLHTSLLHRYSMSFVTALIPNIVKHRVHVWAGPVAPAGVVIALEASAAAPAATWRGAAMLVTVTASTAASTVNSVLCLYHILYVKFWYTIHILYITIIMYWTITHSRKNGRFAFEFMHCHCIMLTQWNTHCNNHITLPDEFHKSAL